MLTSRRRIRLSQLLAPALESLSPAPEWDIDRFAMHHLLGSVINAVSDDAEKCTLFAEVGPNGEMTGFCLIVSLTICACFRSSHPTTLS